MNSRFLKRLKRCRLGVGESRFRAALGKSPTPAAARANQKKLDGTVADPEANRRHLLALAQFAKLRQSYEAVRGPTLSGSCTHRIRVHDAVRLCLEHSLVLAPSKVDHARESFYALAPGDSPKTIFISCRPQSVPGARPWRTCIACAVTVSFCPDTNLLHFICSPKPWESNRARSRRPIAFLSVRNAQSPWPWGHRLRALSTLPPGT